MFKEVFALILILAVITCGIATVLTYQWEQDNPYYTYSGFEGLDEQRYSQFKQALIDSNFRDQVSSVQVLSSEPPIIVKWDFTADYKTDFPFGSIEEKSYNTWRAFLASGITILIALGCFIKAEWV